MFQETYATVKFPQSENSSLAGIWEQKYSSSSYEFYFLNIFIQKFFFKYFLFQLSVCLSILYRLISGSYSMIA